ncbi:DEAD/DEAH box helicase [Lysobacter sp. CAU 1642]|uniref:DEAD/DEAH box helicase n=2 Tax=Pseudomarimonas salicorniae TaxID=2933270 RepID=A0ABT0GF55_9GAMM|nr:DEAD/DEAH box helicase [Lysobacter sp. CAU 1642]MCK7593178.1 DEAD/DEAH box helicase [Lysobacter sp. CAU 1642]
MLAPNVTPLFPSRETLPEAPSRDAGKLVRALSGKHADRITGQLTLPARPADTRPLPEDLGPRIRSALEARGVTALYCHQLQAWEATRRGEHVVIATPTASGKTLCYTLPVLDAVIREQRRALHLFPTKALAQDQLAELLELNRAGELGVRAHTFDGDTPGDARQAVRLHGDIVISNPDMLHQGILPHHTKWAQLFETLRYVVIDEIHSYRGVFGSHLANLLRRLQRICAFYGNRPQFILASATIGNPKEHAEALLGQAVTALTDSGAPSGARHVLLWNPPVVNRDLGIRASARSQSTRIARAAIRAGLKTLVFAQSRLMVEVITKYLKDVFDHDPRKPERIRAYRGGYLPTERRETERRMRAGSIDGLVGTNALELGVDIGSLDVVVLNGYPGSIAATWQRLGRAGRRQRPALGVLVASSEALDQYVVQHPEFFFGAPPEQARIAADQPLILLDHIRCAAFELPFSEGERFGSVEPAPYLQLLADSGVLHEEGGRFEWIADSYPANAVSLRSVADGNFLVIDRSEGRQTIIAEVDYSSAALTLYEGAIHLIQSQPFQVEKLDWVGRKAFVTRTRADYYTDAIDYTKLKPLEIFERGASGAGEVAHGEVHVVRRVAGYKKIRYYTHENIGYGPVTLPDQELHTTSVWWSLPATVLEREFASRQAVIDGFLGASTALHTVATLAVMAEGRDLQKAVGTGDGAIRGRGAPSPFSVPREGDEDTGDFAPTVYLYDNYPGGIGLSEPLYLRSHELLQRARELIERCACAEGCPACIGAQSGEPAAEPPKPLALRVIGLLERAA